MTRKTFRILLILATATIGAPVHAAPAGPGSMRSIVDLKSSIGLLKERYHNDPQWNALAQTVLRTADYFVGTPAFNSLSTRSNDGLAEARNCEHIVFSTSFAFALTGNPRYQARAVKELLFLSSDGSAGKPVYPEWTDGHNLLSVSEMAACFALGYRWNKSALTESQRATIIGRLVDVGLRPVAAPKGLSRNTLAQFFSPGGSLYQDGNYALSNWSGVVNGGLLLAATLIYKEPHAPAGFTADDSSLYDAIVHAFDVYVPAELNRLADSNPANALFSGAWDESLNYYTYFSTYLALCFDVQRDLTGKRHPLESDVRLLNAAEFFEAMTAPSHRQFNFGDAGDSVSYVPLAFFANVFQRRDLAAATDSYLRWFVPQISEMAGRKSPYAKLDRFFPFYLLWYMPAPAQNPFSGKPLARIFKGDNGDFFSARSSWTDPDALFLAAKGGMPAATHAKMDAGTFILEGDGVRWTSDIGGYGNYGLSHYFGGPRKRAFEGRWQYFVNNNLSQNTLTFFDEDGRPIPQDPQGTARISRAVLGFPGTDVSFDLSAVYEGSVSRAVRTFHITSAKSMSVEDVVDADEGISKVRWAAVFCADDARRDSVSVQKNRALLKKDGHAADWVIEKPANARFVLESVDPADPMNHEQKPEAELINSRNHQSETVNMPDLALCRRLALYADPRSDHEIKVDFTLH